MTCVSTEAEGGHGCFLFTRVNDMHCFALQALCSRAVMVSRLPGIRDLLCRVAATRAFSIGGSCTWFLQFTLMMCGTCFFS